MLVNNQEFARALPHPRWYCFRGWRGGGGAPFFRRTLYFSNAGYLAMLIFQALPKFSCGGW
jgi:hypothetical protein